MLVTKIKITLTEEHDTVDDVSRNTNEEDEGVDVAIDDIVYGSESLKSDDVIGIVPGNKIVCVTIALAISMVDLNLHCRRRCIL